MADYTKEELEFFLKDEQKRAENCADEFTKQLLINRCKMWQRLLSDNIETHKEKEDKDAASLC